MSFLDNLENSLKSLESVNERDDRQTQQQRDAERAQALAIAPWAEKLKAASFTNSLLNEATRAGHKIRAKARITWLGPTLRLEVRDRKLELRPTPTGIMAIFIQNGSELHARPINLDQDSPEELVRQWLG